MIVKSYQVSFSIDVSAENPEQACQVAWILLSGPGAFKPVGEVWGPGANGKLVDLEELETAPTP